MKVRHALTDQLVDQARAKAKPYKIADGGGLCLLVNTTGSKWWRLNYRVKGKYKTLAIGTYPDVSLTEARERREEARKLLADGIAPSVVKQAHKAELNAKKTGALEAQIAEEARLIAATRFMLDNEGALSFRFGKRHIALTSGETTELRTFLDATRAVTPKVTLCP